MTLLGAFLDIVGGWRPVFRRSASHSRAVRQALGGLLCLGRRTLSRIIWTNGGEQRSWSGEYHQYSRSPWNAQDLFTPILYCGPLFVLANELAVQRGVDADHPHWEEGHLRMTRRQAGGR